MVPNDADGWGAIANEVLKFKKFFKFESSCIVIYFSYIYPIINGERSLISKESSYKFRKLIKDQKTVSTRASSCQFVT